MKRLLNTLYITSQGAYLSRERETVVVRVKNEIKMRIPIHTLDSIICFGRVLCSPALLGLCGGNHVQVSFLSYNGRFLARVQGPISGNVLLRREQYRRADDIQCAGEIAKAVVIAKIANCRTVLLRAARDKPDNPNREKIRQDAEGLSRLLTELRDINGLDTVRGMEGKAAVVYFNVFDHLIFAQKSDFSFEKRNRRPPMDNVNALLSFHYTLLVHDVTSALESVGLDPAVGFLHRDRPGRPGLALDMMEEFRPFLADRLTLSLVNRNQINGGQFEKTESGAVMMNEKARKKVLVAYQKRKQEEINHPFLGERIPVGLLPYVQALLLARYLRGDLDGYPAFIWK
jgi:CRISPR-associated protein Cas1